jgi:transcription antitermination factor NusG
LVTLGNIVWYALFVETSKEGKIVSFLKSAGFKANDFPLVFKRTHKRTKKTIISHRAMFPGYVFVGVPCGGVWPRFGLNSVVCSFVKAGNPPHPVPIPASTMKHIESVHSGLKDEIRWSTIKYRVGELVKYSYLGWLFEGEVLSQTGDLLKIATPSNVGSVVASVGVESVVAN